MISIRLDSNIHGLYESMALAPGRTARAISRSVNRAANSTASLISHELSLRSGLKRRPTRERVQVTRRAYPGSPEAEITVEGGDLAIGLFSRPWLERQDDVDLSHSFTIPEAGPHHRFVRVGEPRLPIREIVIDPGLELEVRERDMLVVAEANAREVFDKRLAHELELIFAAGGYYSEPGE